MSQKSKKLEITKYIVEVYSIKDEVDSIGIYKDKNGRELAHISSQSSIGFVDMFRDLEYDRKNND